MGFARTICVATALLCLTWASHADQQYDVIVIGAGPSGIGAITRLTEKGYKVLGLEAKDRLGGRVNTQEFGGGLVEFGAEWIHGEDGNEVYRIARENEVPIIDDKFNQQVQSFRPVNQTVMKELTQACLNVYENIGVHGKGNETMGDVITRKFYEYISNHPALREDSEFCRNYLKLFEGMLAPIDGVDSWNDIEALSESYSEGDQCGGSLAWSWGKLGYRTLFDILLHKYKNGTALPVNIQLNEVVTEINWDKPLVSVKTASGKSYEAKAVIVTVSLGVLKHSHKDLFKPALPATKVQAIEALSFGVVNKICLHYDTAWWGDKNYIALLWNDEERAKIPKEDEWITKIPDLTTPQSNNRVLTLWLTGIPARHMETLSMDTIKGKVQGLLKLFFKGVDVPQLKDIRRSTWFSDPNVRGSYSFHGKPADRFPNASYHLATPLLREDKPTLLFAGEATHKKYHSTVHGALESGWREAERFHEAYKK